MANANKTGSGPETKIQVGFRVPQSLHDRIQSECLKREVSLQDLMMGALKLYLQTPAASDVIFGRGSEEVRKSSGKRSTLKEPPRRRQQYTIHVPESWSDNDRDWLELCIRYAKRMPAEKTQLIANVMKLDLMHYRSSRRRLHLQARNLEKTD